MIISGVPFFIPEDATRDNRIDLQDAIVLVREVARTADGPVEFVSTMGKTLSALHIVAGLKEHLESPVDPKNISSDHMFLAIQPSHSFYCFLNASIIKSGDHIKARTINPDPVAPFG